MHLVKILNRCHVVMVSIKATITMNHTQSFSHDSYILEISTGVAFCPRSLLCHLVLDHQEKRRSGLPFLLVSFEQLFSNMNRGLKVQLLATSQREKRSEVQQVCSQPGRSSVF